MRALAPLSLITLLAVLALVACGSATSSSGADPASSATPSDPTKPSPTGAPTGSPMTSTPDAGGGDAHAGDGGTDGGVATKTYRNSLSVCWTDATCPRAMVVAHGGDWSVTTVPYGSMGAVIAAFNSGADAVKLDVRVTKDNVPVISHSSPIEAYESLDCYNQKIEDMTAAQVASCHFVQKSSEAFQRLDTMLNYARGKMTVQLTVKLPADYARTIAEVSTLGAQDFAFLEVSTAELQTVLPPLPGYAQTYFLVNVASNLTEIDTLIGTVKNPHAFMYELDPSAAASTAITTKIHPANVRAFTYDSSATASTAELSALFTQGFDVVSANTTPANEAARIARNQARGVSPP